MLLVPVWVHAHRWHAVMPLGTLCDASPSVVCTRPYLPPSPSHLHALALLLPLCPPTPTPQRRLHRTNSASTLVPTPRAAWSHTAAWAGARANPLPHVDLPAAAAGGGGSFSCTNIPSCHSPHYRDTPTPATSPSPLRRSCNTVGAGHDRLFRSSTVPLQQQQQQQQVLGQAQTQLLQSMVSSHASASQLSAPSVSLSPRLANLLGGVGQGARSAMTERGQRPGTR